MGLPHIFSTHFITKNSETSLPANLEITQPTSETTICAVILLSKLLQFTIVVDVFIFKTLKCCFD